MNVAQFVQAHPKRAALAHDLAARIDGTVVYDPEPDSPIRHAWRTLRHLLENAPGDATHLGHVQDDAEVCDRYAEAVENAVAARPDRVLTFYVGAHGSSHSRAVQEACSRDHAWAELGLGQWIPCVAMCWPVELARDLLDWDAKQTFPPRFGSDDERIGRWCQQRRERVLASVPSLADHRCELPSLIRDERKMTRTSWRYATCFIGVDVGDAALAIDWTAGPGG